MKPVFISIAALAILASGCTTAPDQIQPAAYASGCSADPSVDVQKLNVLTAQQRQAREADIIGVMLIGVPMAKLSGGDKSSEIARLKACIK